MDDDLQIAQLVSLVLGPEGYSCLLSSTLDDARRQLAADGISVCLCDVDLAGQSGLELAAEIQQNRPDIALVMMSGYEDTNLARQAISVGAYDYLVKPFRNSELLITVANAFHRRRLEQEAGHLRQELEQTVARRTLELALSREETIHRLARAVEFRDAHTGLHVERMAAFCRMIALRLGLPPSRCTLIRTASLLHDIGKLGIPDRILVKPGPLTDEERAEIKQHTTLGHSILSGSTSELIQLASQIALSHHERWDGTGYPRGLGGEEIPLEGRIAAVCDVFDALTSSRPYREQAFSQRQAVDLLLSERGKAFDPAVVDAFIEGLDDVDRIRSRYADSENALSAA